MDTLLTPEELAQILGLSVQTIYNRRYNGANLPPALKLGNQIRYRQKDIEHWLDTKYERQSADGHGSAPLRGRPTKAQMMHKKR